MRMLVTASLAACIAAFPATLPPVIIAGYASDRECDSAVITAAKNGVNVIIWSFITFTLDSNGAPFVNTTDAPDLDCVASTARTLSDLNLTTVHLISAGGWGAVHPLITSGSRLYAAFLAWNVNVVRRGDFNGFDGLDWDMEGANDPTSPTNTFTVPCLDAVGVASTLARSDGYIVSLVPPESYFDVTTSTFDRSLIHDYPDCQPGFKYHGHNAYAYLESRYGPFHFVTVQLYESYSHAWCAISSGTAPDAYLISYIPRLYAGWWVNFTSDPAVSWPSQTVAVQSTRVLIGLANGWTDGSRALLLQPDAVGRAHAALATQGLQPRGYAFWDIGDEGQVPGGGPGTPLYLAAGLNDFLHTRG